MDMGGEGGSNGGHNSSSKNYTRSGKSGSQDKDSRSNSRLTAYPEVDSDDDEFNSGDDSDTHAGGVRKHTMRRNVRTLSREYLSYILYLSYSLYAMCYILHYEASRSACYSAVPLL